MRPAHQGPLPKMQLSPPTAEEVLLLPALEVPLLPCTARFVTQTLILWDAAETAQEGLLPACCSHRKARQEPFLSHVASQLLPPDLAIPRSHSMTHFPRSAMQMMVFPASASATSLFDLLFIRLIYTSVSLLFLATEVLYPTLESSSALKKYDVLQSYHKARWH